MQRMSERALCEPKPISNLTQAIVIATPAMTIATLACHHRAL
jgi:hypothetical protein